jgi:hypothetical protein
LQTPGRRNWKRLKGRGGGYGDMTEDNNIYETEIRGVPVKILNANSLTPDEIQWVKDNVKKNIIKRDAKHNRHLLN